MPWAEHDYAEPLPSKPPAFHPEMGYLAPSLSTRRLLRIGLIAGVGIALGAFAAVSHLPAQNTSAAMASTTSTMGELITTGRAENSATLMKESDNPSPNQRLASSPAAPADGSRGAVQGATPAADELTLAEEPQSPAVTAPQPEKRVRKKKIARVRQDDTRNAYALPYGGRYDYGTRYDYGMRSAQQQRTDTRGWWW